ncbi:MAG: DUF4115 domain-containing protein, partial [Rhodospirillaceae bacterium]|nr:DUF4115 domain-containing protein [Rhodospirillaceae bacterium]
GMPRAVIVPAPAIPGVQLASTPATEPASAAPPALPQGQVYGTANQDSRVTLLARLESWVRVTDRNQRTVWTRVLREGESYLVPNEPGLMLTTGNAGGLQIFVDGKPVPPIGGVGAVTRNVPLDPETLLASAGGPTVQ